MVVDDHGFVKDVIMPEEVHFQGAETARQLIAGEMERQTAHDDDDNKHSKVKTIVGRV